MQNNAAIIVAGGVGKRLPGATKKQFLQIGGIPILIHSICPFLNSNDVSSIVVVLPDDELEEGKQLIKGTIAGNLRKEMKFVAGGSRRQDSVYNGLLACDKQTDIVFIHDGVRPFITGGLIRRLLVKCEEHGAVIPVTPVRYTLKKVENDLVQRTIPRHEVFEAHTPQVFNYPVIMSYHHRIHDLDVEFTDDASILEYFRETVATEICNETNIKITRPSDLDLAETIYKKINKEIS